MPVISVIMPIYKVEAYLDRCVESVLCQTFRDFELILVDDGSPDRCGEMCEEWAKKDSRIRVIHKKNGGLSDARNAGMDWSYENSESEWLSFIDSDDYIHPRMLEALLNAAIENNVKVSICGYAETHGELLPDVEIIPKVWAVKDLYRDRNLNATVAWGKIYHKDCFTNVRYPVGRLHEDEFVTYKILFAGDTAVMIDAPLYAYYQNPKSITRTTWSPKRLDGLDGRREQLKFFESYGDTDLYRFSVMSAFVLVCMYLDEIPSNSQYKREIKMLKKEGRKLLRISSRNGFFRDKKYLWMYSRIYPRITGAYCLCLVLLGKLGIKLAQQ